MSHTINGFIGPVDELQRLTTGLKHARIALLDVDGYGFLPYTHDLSNEIGKGWYDLGRKAQKPLAHVETDYFGGAGEQSAAFWKNGQKVFKAKKVGAIDQALKLLGVVSTPGNDEFDTLGLGNFRSNDDWATKGNIASDKDEEERLEAIRVLDEMRKNHDTATDSCVQDVRLLPKTKERHIMDQTVEKILIEKALEGCQQGKVNDALRKLYLAPVRELVPWNQFPAWARPMDPVEGAHEG